MNPRVSAVVVTIACASCVAATTPAADNATDLRYRLAERPTADATAIQIYGWIGERSLATPSRCKMVPTDSAAFSARAASCGGLAAWYQGVARLLLEQASSERFARSIQLDGRLRWMDLPAPCGE